MRVSFFFLSLSTLVQGQQRSDFGPRDRFWRHHVTQKTLIHQGVDQYENIQQCLTADLDLDALAQDTATSIRRPGMKLRNEDGEVVAVVIKDAMLPQHVKAVQTLAACVQKHMPSLYESRAMYQEMNLDEDDGSGGNCPTHLAPLVSIFLPFVTQEMQRTLQVAYTAANWKEWVEYDEQVGTSYEIALQPPHQMGIRASEHLTYKDFPLLAPHTDGSTSYTMNFAFSGPDDYEGGAFYLITGSGRRKRKSAIKPNKYECLVFLGGRYMHGVNEITGGHREMFRYVVTDCVRGTGGNYTLTFLSATAPSSGLTPTSRSAIRSGPIHPTIWKSTYDVVMQLVTISRLAHARPSIRK